MKLYLFNPLNHEVKTTYNLDGDFQEYVLPSEKIWETENETIFRHMREFLVEAVLNERNIVHYDHNREEVRKEVVKEL